MLLNLFIPIILEEFSVSPSNLVTQYRKKFDTVILSNYFESNTFAPFRKIFARKKENMTLYKYHVQLIKQAGGFELKIVLNIHYIHYHLVVL